MYVDREPSRHGASLAVRDTAMAALDGFAPPAWIVDSWARCRALGMARDIAVQMPVVEAAELGLRRDRADLVRTLARAELETLSHQIAGSNFLLAFADRDGVILDLVEDNRFSMSGSGAGIVAGSRWSESIAGTNGLGTALAVGSPVAVAGPEHFLSQFSQIACTAAPVRDALGQVVGALDASSYCESRQRHTQALVQMAATHIENGLLAHQMRGHLILAVHPRAEFLGTLSAGLVAFDEGGLLQGMNGPARALLVGMQAAQGAGFETLFGESLEQVMDRLRQHLDVRLNDALGCALVARMVGRPLAAAQPVGRSRTLLPRPWPAQRPGPSESRQPARANPPMARASAEFLVDDPAVQEACRLVEAAVRLNVPILLQGETGTGKELLARHAHRASGRRGEFVAVNCAAMPAELFEAELFGYVGGAYSGSRREGSEGLLRAADGGTLLLDEVRELPLPLQAALLRFLDDQQVRAVGGRRSVAVDVQVLAASHANLEDEVTAHRFRQDLLYRLNTVRVALPPLRRRRDFAQAVQCLLGQIDPGAEITADAVARLAQHDWPGNFRELRSVLTRLLLVRPSHGGDAAPAACRITLDQVAAELPESAASASGSALQRNAAELVRQAFERHGRSVSQTSRSLGISRTTVYRHLKA